MIICFYTHRDQTGRQYAGGCCWQGDEWPRLLCCTGYEQLRLIIAHAVSTIGYTIVLIKYGHSQGWDAICTQTGTRPEINKASL